METLLAICVGNSPVTAEFPWQRPAMTSFDVLFELRLSNREAGDLRRHLAHYYVIVMSISLALCTRNPQLIGDFPLYRTNNAENPSMPWCHRDFEMSIPIIALYSHLDRLWSVTDRIPWHSKNRQNEGLDEIKPMIKYSCVVLWMTTPPMMLRISNQCDWTLSLISFHLCERSLSWWRTYFHIWEGYISIHVETN